MEEFSTPDNSKHERKEIIESLGLLSERIRVYEEEEYYPEWKAEAIAECDAAAELIEQLPPEPEMEDIQKVLDRIHALDKILMRKDPENNNDTPLAELARSINSYLSAVEAMVAK